MALLSDGAVVETSGSTGRPKRVVLSGAAFRASAAAAADALGAPGDWVLALPTAYVAGLNVLARAEHMGTRVLDGTADVVAAIGLAEGDRVYTSLVPIQLQRLLDTEGGEAALRRCARVLVGGQAPDAGLIARARDAGVAVTVTYGATETCGGCVWDGAPIGDTEAAIIGGVVHIAGSVLADGYLDDAALTAEAFPVIDGRRWHRTRDRGRLIGDRLEVLGRVDDVIASGGVKVSLGEIEAVVRGLPGLADAVVVPVERTGWGSAPVVVGTAPADRGVLRAILVEALGPAAAPIAVLVVEALPTLPNGKPDRLAIEALARSRVL